MLDDLRFSDVLTFLTVHRVGTVSGAARALRVTPSQVSKSVRRLEEGIGATLLIRSARGITLSESGREVMPRLEALAARVRELHHVDRRLRQLTIAAPSYLQAALLPPIARRLGDRRLTAIELPPALVRAQMAENLFDVALMVGEADVPPTWTVVPVGRARKALFATPALRRRLGARPVDPGKLAGLEFITPLSMHHGQFVPADDGCPLGVQSRQAGHHVQTFPLGLELAAGTDQLIFGPVVAARPWVERGRLVEVRVRGWDASDPLLVVSNGDRLRASDQRRIVDAARAALEELDPPRTAGREIRPPG